MTGLPTSLSIGLWLVGSIWLVAALAYAFDVSEEVVWAALIAGLLAGFVEWLVRRRARR
jgi:predicted PurR-regulated permease PerM